MPIKKVLSFDVGIINLAYCLLEIDDSNQTFKIDKWDIIDLSANKRNLCCFLKKGKKDRCNNVAKYMVKINDDNCQYYCKAHAGKAELDIRPVDLKWSEVNKSEKNNKCSLCNKCGEYACNLIDGKYCLTHKKNAISTNNYKCITKKCKNPITQGLYITKPNEDNKQSQCELMHGWCSEHFDDEYRAYIKKKTKKDSQNGNKISLTTLCTSMYQKLDQIPELLKVDEILVENQPTFINPTMKTVSAMLFSYFIMRGIHEKTKTHSTVENVIFCSPSNKIKVGGKDADKKLEEADESKVYKVTKKLSVKYCKALLDDNDDWLKVLDSHKKKDDMADAFLQGFIKNFGPTIPKYYADKIKNVEDLIEEPKKSTKATKATKAAKSFKSKIANTAESVKDETQDENQVENQVENTATSDIVSSINIKTKRERKKKTIKNKKNGIKVEIDI